MKVCVSPLVSWLNNRYLPRTESYKVAAAIAAEADRSLGGLGGNWNLGIAIALLSERAALVELHDRKELEMINEETE